MAFSLDRDRTVFGLVVVLTLLCASQILRSTDTDRQLQFSQMLNTALAEQGEVDAEWRLTAVCERDVVAPDSSCTPLVDRGNGRVLVTGGAGFIGSHTVLELLKAGYSVTVLDNLANSSPQSIERVAKLAKVDSNRLQFVLMDLRDAAGLKRVLTACGLKAVGESVKFALEYYENNVVGTVNLLQAMAAGSVDTIIFSSSATVYGNATPPLRESALTGVGVTNPYGQTKYVIERMLRDLTSSQAIFQGAANSVDWKICSLRYFNPVGADPSGLIGEQPSGVPNNLMPYIAQVATNIRKHLTVFGTDYPTRDGTGERDYIHVVDLALGHVAALKRLERAASGRHIDHFNLGTGHATSVLELVAGFRAACQCDVPIVNGSRRAGDLAQLYADASLAADKLNWKATRSVDSMCADTWRFVSSNPEGFASCAIERANTNE